MTDDDTPETEGSDPAVTRQMRAARRTARRHHQRRLLLVQTTRQLLEDEGPAALSASAIARACDLTPSALYHYFDHLEDLLAAVHVDLFREELTMAMAALDAAENGAAPNAPLGFDCVCALVRAKVRFGTDNPKRWRALYQGAAGFPTTSPALANELVPLSHQFFARVEAHLKADQEKGHLDKEASPRLLANLAFCQTQGILTMAMAADAAGTDTLFGVNVLVDSALETFRRAWFRTP